MSIVRQNLHYIQKIFQVYRGLLRLKIEQKKIPGMMRICFKRVGDSKDTERFTHIGLQVV